MPSREAAQLNSVEEQLANIPLQPHGAGGVDSVDAWESIATSQQVPNSDVLTDSKVGSVIALEDRNMFTMPWRKIIIVREKDDYVLYDSDGWLINEPSYGVAQGRQPVNELVSEFTSDNPFMYYRPPNIRKGPANRRNGSSSEETDTAIASEPATTSVASDKPTETPDKGDPGTPAALVAEPIHEEEGVPLPEPASNAEVAECATETALIMSAQITDAENAAGTQVTQL